ncbi:hypothetical protein E4T52_10155 [Aureobasidium sp. EXF-3400]|nr:hypothetical protein E4T51_09169 [Aureobasidium sp. EXF-12344]KAI4774912.1 hypothetical protein E4T52_10155 [Aureobasidium sp. EXF-3400]
MSAVSMDNAQTELRKTIGKSSERCSKKLIRSRIDKIVNKYQSNNRCRLSDEELVLLALAYSSGEWLLTSQIGEFAFFNIRFFQKQAARFFFGRSGYQTQGRGIHDLARRTERVTMLTKRSSYLRTYGIPVHTKLDSNNQRVYSMTAGAAYAFVEATSSKRNNVAHAILGKGTSASPLLGLPAELLFKICRMVLKVSGFRLLVGNKSFMAYDEKVPIWDTRSQDALTMPPVQDFLALLSVNKEVHQYAMPEFFHSNHFQFRDMGSLKTFLQNIGPERRKHIRNVSLHYENLSVAAAGARLLAESDHLQKLTMIMSATQDPAGHFTINASRRKFTTLSKIPGFSSLKRLRGIQQLTFDPNREHAVIDAFLRPAITQPKPPKLVKKVKRAYKRKVVFGGDAGAAKKFKSA